MATEGVSEMSDASKAADIAATLFNEGRTVNEVISTLYEPEDFEQYRFFEANGFLYMEDDDGRFPAQKLCSIPEGAKDNG